MRLDLVHSQVLEKEAQCATQGAATQEERPGSRFNQAGGESIVGPHGYMPLWGPQGPIQAGGGRGFHCCVRMSLGEWGRARGGSYGRDQLYRSSVSGHLGRMLITSLWGCWGSRKIGNFKNLYYIVILISSFSHMPHPTHQHVFLVLPFYIIQNPTPHHVYHYHQNHHPLPIRPIRPHYLSPGFLRLPLYGFPSTFVPLYFIFCAAASVLLLKFIKLRLFSVHTPTLASLLLRVKYQVLTVVFDLIYIYFTYTG